MKTKKIASGLFGLVYLLFQVTLPSAVAFAEEEVPPPPDEEEYAYNVQTFIITAYYSPLPGQEHYVTGSYEGDIRLNGNGTNGADGTPVFPGMVAAPKSYPFGLKLYIPGVGMTSVHDRGGAIVTAGNRGNAYDRLDVWMGAGDEGLRKALGWGKRTVDVFVYGDVPAIQEAVYFDSYMNVENFMTQTVFSPLEFPNDLYFGKSGDEIKKMQGYLHDWGYLLMEPDGFYGTDTAQALFQFQMDYEIVSDPDELGAGHFGPATRRKFDDLIKKGGVSQDDIKLQRGSSLMAKYSDLYEEEKLFGTSLELGDSGETVRRLQEELRDLGFLRIEPSGYFGDTTEHALFKFQQSLGLVSAATDSGAGYLGPNTRNALNGIIEKRYNTKSVMAYQREELSAGRLTLPLPVDQVALNKQSLGGLPQ